MKTTGDDCYKGIEFTVPVTVKPAKPKVTLSSKSRKITVKYGKLKGVSGYEIQYSLKKNFQSGVKKYNVKKVKKVTSKLKKGKKYYVRVRAYVNLGNEKIYSAWSVKKSIKVR